MALQTVRPVPKINAQDAMRRRGLAASQQPKAVASIGGIAQPPPTAMPQYTQRPTTGQIRSGQPQALGGGAQAQSAMPQFGGGNLGPNNGMGGGQPQAMPQYGTPGTAGQYGQTGAYQAGGNAIGGGWTGMAQPNVRGVGTAGAPGNPYSQVDINQLPASSEMRNAMGDARSLPSYFNQYQQNSTPSASVYGNTAGQARGALGNILGGGAGAPSEQPFMDYGRNLLNQANTGAPGMPAAPDLLTPGGPYTAKPAGTTFDYSTMNLGTYPGTAASPTIGGVADPNRFGMAGPNVDNPSFDELMGYVNTGMGNVPGRETIGAERFGADPLAQEAFKRSMASAEGISGGMPDVNNTYAEQFKAAALAGANKAGGRGFTDLGGTMAGKAMGQELGLAAERAAGEKSGLQLQAADISQRGREAATSALTNVGQSSAGAATDIGKLNLESTQGAQGLNVEQRGQDVSMARDAAGRGTTASDVANLLRAKNEGQIGGFEAGTSRGAAQGDLDLRASQLTQSGQLEGFREQTNRMNTLIEGVKAGNADAIAQYQAATQRGEVTGDLNKDASRLQYDYDTLTSADKNAYGNRQVDLYGKQADAATNAYNAQTGRYDTLLGGGAQYANIGQTGDVQRRQNQIRIGELANSVMSGAADATAVDNEMNAAMLRGDQQYVNELIQLKMQLAQAGAEMRQAGRTAVGGAVGSAIGGALSGGLPLLRNPRPSGG